MVYVWIGVGSVGLGGCFLINVGLGYGMGCLDC